MSWLTSVDLGFQPYLTTGDIINMLTMAFIGLIVIITVWEKLMLMRGKSSDIRNCFCGFFKSRKPKVSVNGTNGTPLTSVAVSEVTPEVSGTIQRKKNSALDIAFAPGLTAEGDFVSNADDLRIPFYQSVSFWAFITLLAVYLAVNVGLLVGYRA
jgi:hypothetical protein